MPAIGEIMLTPYDPPGRVQVLDVTDPDPRWPWYGMAWARVRYLHDHSGYPCGSIGWYAADELRPLQSVDWQIEH